jgi:hypothetical protein
MPSHESKINTNSPASLLGQRGLGEAAPAMKQLMPPSCVQGWPDQEGQETGSQGQLPLGRPALDFKGQVAPR